MRKRSLAAVSVVLTAVFCATAAAHYYYDFSYVWEGTGAYTGKCMKARAETSDGVDQGGYSKGNGFAQREQDTEWGMVQCAVGWKRDLKLKMILQKETSSGWTKCRETAWKYVYATEIQQEKYWNAPCGAGYYRTRVLTYLKLNGEWKGGGMTHDGKHWLH